MAMQPIRAFGWWRVRDEQHEALLTVDPEKMALYVARAARNKRRRATAANGAVTITIRASHPVRRPVLPDPPIPGD